MPPSSPNYKRDYKQEYKVSQGTPDEIAKRSSRNKARRAMEKAGKVRLGDGKDVDHRDHNPKNNSKGNLRVQSKSANRSFPRNKKAGKK